MALLYSQKLPTGWQGADFYLKGTDESVHRLAEYTDKKALVIIFSCNHCPYAKASWPLLNELYKKFSSDARFVAINPNDAINFPEDSFEMMKKRTDILFPYLFDETQSAAKAYQAQCTPDLYLFKNVMGKPSLYYHGRINDNWQNPKDVKEKNFELAIQELLADHKPPINQPPSMGCSIKWR